MLKSKEVFGEDAEVFRPERFLECDDTQKSYMLKVMDISFGHGRWLCLGKPLAIIELNKIYVEVSYSADPLLPFNNSSKMFAIIDANIHLFLAVAGLRLPTQSRGTTLETEGVFGFGR
jgi:hypothetical protein